LDSLKIFEEGKEFRVRKLHSGLFRFLGSTNQHEPGWEGGQRDLFISRGEGELKEDS
jgi:hypothetical protein